MFEYVRDAIVSHVYLRRDFMWTGLIFDTTGTYFEQYLRVRNVYTRYKHIKLKQMEVNRIVLFPFFWNGCREIHWHLCEFFMDTFTQPACIETNYTLLFYFVDVWKVSDY